MNIFGKLAVSALALSVASVASAASISGSTDFRVTLPELLVLYHWDDAHLILTDAVTTPANDSDEREISDATTRDLTANIGNGTYTINTDVDTTDPTSATTNLGIANVTLKNSWAVRSLSTAPVTLALTNPNATLINTAVAGSTITTRNATLASTGTGVTGTGTASMTIPSGFAPVLGDIVFQLNLANANNSGEYNTRGAAGPATATDEATDTFLLTLTGN